MSNYYYDEKDRYLTTLAQVRTDDHNLTPFLVFGLRGIKLQCDRLFDEIKKNVSKALFRNMMFDLFNRLKSTRQRVLAERQIALLKVLLKKEYFLEVMRYRVRRLFFKGLQRRHDTFHRFLILSPIRADDRIS